MNRRWIETLAIVFDLHDEASIYSIDANSDLGRIRVTRNIR